MTDRTSSRADAARAEGDAHPRSSSWSMFALCIIGTYHKPHPNGINVGVVGPAAQTAPLRAGLAEGGRLGVRHQPGYDGRRRHARRPRARPRRGLRAARGPEAARDRDRRRRRRPHRRDGGRDARPLGRRDPGSAARRARCPPAAARGRDRGRHLHVHDRLHDLRLPRRRPSSFTVAPALPPGRRYAISRRSPSWSRRSPT